MSTTDEDATTGDEGGGDSHLLANPQEGYKMMRDVARVMPMEDSGMGMGAMVLMLKPRAGAA